MVNLRSKPLSWKLHGSVIYQKEFASSRTTPKFSRKLFATTPFVIGWLSDAARNPAGVADELHL